MVFTMSWMRAEMDGVERVIRAVNFQKTDRLPVIPEIFGFSARYMGVSISDYVRDGGVLATCQIETWRDFEYDGAFAFADLSVEAEALGCELAYPHDSYPYIVRHAIEDVEDLNNLKLPDPERDGRMPVILDACKILRKEFGNRVFIAGNVLGPISIAGQLLGLERLLYLMADDPSALKKLLDFTTEVTIRFGQAIIQAGAHSPIVFNPMASPNVIPRGIFEAFELPNLKKVFMAFRRAGSPVNWMSIAGNTSTILSLFPAAHVNLATIDYSVSLEYVRRMLPELAINGNIKPFFFNTLHEEGMREEVLRIIREIGDSRGFILGSGCEIPLESKPENLIALVRGVGDIKNA